MATILIADDLPDNRRFLAMLLGHEGHQCLEATDGVDALARARAVRPDLVICDIRLPKMDGHELAFRLWTDPAITRTPVIFYTADRQDPRDALLAEQWGVARVVAKPAAPEQILRAVAAALQSDQARHPRSAPGSEAGGIGQPNVDPPTGPRSLPTEPASRPGQSRPRQLADHGVEVVWTSDSNGERILYIHPDYERVWGRTWPSLRADDPSRMDAIHPDDRARVQFAIACRGLRGDYSVEYRLARPDGSFRWISSYGIPIRDSLGRLSGSIEVARDITDRLASGGSPAA